MVVENVDELPKAWAVDYAPFCFHIAVSWTTHRLFIEPDGLNNSRAVHGLIHEAGHVFGCLHPPLGSKEFNFFGWELALAKELQCMEGWENQNHDYAVGKDSEVFSDLNLAQVANLYETRLRVAKELGLVVNGKAVPVRKGTLWQQLELCV